MQPRASRARNCFTRRSSPEWYESTASRPDPARARRARDASPASSSASSSFTAMRSAWNTSVAGWCRRAGQPHAVERGDELLHGARSGVFSSSTRAMRPGMGTPPSRSSVGQLVAARRAPAARRRSRRSTRSMRMSSGTGVVAGAEARGRARSRRGARSRRPGRAARRRRAGRRPRSTTSRRNEKRAWKSFAPRAEAAQALLGDREHLRVAVEPDQQAVAGRAARGSPRRARRGRSSRRRCARRAAAPSSSSTSVDHHRGVRRLHRVAPRRKREFSAVVLLGVRDLGLVARAVPDLDAVGEAHEHDVALELRAAAQRRRDQDAARRDRHCTVSRGRRSGARAPRPRRSARPRTGAGASGRTSSAG